MNIIVFQEVNLPLDLQQYIKPNMADSETIVLPLTRDELTPLPAAMSRNRVELAAARPSMGPSAVSGNSSSRVGLDELLPLLRTHPIPTLLHDEPGLILNMLRSLAGPKPDGSRAPQEPTDSNTLPDHIQNLIRLAVSNPNLIRTMAKFDPGFIPNIVNTILGIDIEEQQKDSEE